VDQDVKQKQEKHFLKVQVLKKPLVHILSVS